MIVPGSANPLLMATRGDPIDDFGVIKNSVRFRSAVSPSFHRVMGAGANRKKGAISIWLKPTKVATASISNNGNMHVFMADNSTNLAGSGLTAYSRIAFVGDDTNPLNRLQWHSSGSAGEAFTTNELKRDPASHAHLYVRWDTTVPMLECYWNGVEVSYASRTLPTLNADTIIGVAAGLLKLGIFTNIDARYFEGYMSRPIVLFGSAPAVTAFGAFHQKTGQWRPKLYTGGYGAHDSYMDFSDGSAATAAALGADRSGNGNNWTPTNISVAAGYTQDWVTDTPTIESCTLNSLANGSTTLAAGALEITGTTTGAVHGTLLVPRDYPVYFEVENVSTNNYNLAIGAGVVRTNVMPSANYQISGTAGIDGWYSSNGPYAMKDNGTSQALTTSTAQAGDVIQVAINGNNGWIGKNDVWFDSAGGTTGNPATGANPTFTLSSAFDYVPYVHVYANTARANFGQRAWSKTCPAGFKAINKKNRSFPAFPRPKEHFDALAYAGDGNATQAVTGLLFPPDFLNIKSRAGTSGAAGWGVFDRIRGATKRLRYDSPAAETVEGLASLDALGFTLNKTGGLSNEASTTYVAHAWKLGGAPIANNAGTIASQVSANVLAGVSAVAYTGTGAAATIGHGLGAVPKMILVKNTNNVGGTSAGFCMGHASLNAGVNPWNYFLQTWTTAGAQAAATSWNNTAPDNAKFSVANDLGTNYNGASYIAYCFAEVPGFSKFGDFQGNSSADGTFVNCGFAPRYVLVKDTAGTSWWFEWDSARETYNVMGKVLNFNTTNAETAGTAYNIDFVSNGFKFRWGGGDPNQSGKTYVFAAFAEFPGRYANAR